MQSTKQDSVDIFNWNLEQLQKVRTNSIDHIRTYDEPLEVYISHKNRIRGLLKSL